jgi:DNA polymerase III delta subunit
MTFRQSNNFTMAELTRALELLLDADIRLKTSGQNASIVLENATLRICADEGMFAGHMSQSSGTRE